MHLHDKGALLRALSIRDLTLPEEGPHAMQIIVQRVVTALESAWGTTARWIRASPIVSVSDNYDELGYPPDAVARDRRYTRYVADGVLLRTQTSALVPSALRALAREPRGPEDVLLACPGLVYRRDQVDRLHTGEPHQLDLWRIRRGPPLQEEDLLSMISIAVEAALPGSDWREQAAIHPYTTRGRQIDVCVEGRLVEIGECGLASNVVLRRAGLTHHSGLAMGLGLDRLVMLAKGLDDIRLLRSRDPRVADQMLDLSPYRRVSVMPRIRRDLSVAMAGPTDAEHIGDRVRSALGDDADLVEEVRVLSETPGEALPAAAAARLGLLPGQCNVLLRIELSALDRTLTQDEASSIRDRVYAALHEGTVHTWALGPPG